MTNNKGNTITLIDTNTERVTALMKEHKAPVSCLASITNTGLILSGSNDNTIRIWNPKSNRCIATIRHPAKPTCIVPLTDHYAAVGDNRGYFSIILLTN
jgi:WD40 repeat protein